MRLLLIALSILAPWSAVAEDDPPKIHAIGRYAIETNVFTDLYEYVEMLNPNGIHYDERFRHPYLPLGAVVIDCQLIHRIGISLTVDVPAKPGRQLHLRSDPPWSKMIKVQYHWHHSSSDKLARSYFVVHQPMFGNVLSDGLTLSKKTRVDGVWTVTVNYDDEEIYETSFRLVRCPTGDS